MRPSTSPFCLSLSVCLSNLKVNKLPIKSSVHTRKIFLLSGLEWNWDRKNSWPTRTEEGEVGEKGNWQKGQQGRNMEPEKVLRNKWMNKNFKRNLKSLWVLVQHWLLDKIFIMWLRQCQKTGTIAEMKFNRGNWQHKQNALGWRRSNTNHEF